TVDTVGSGAQETVMAVAPTAGVATNQIGIYATFAHNHALGVPVTYVPSGIAGCTGSGSFLLANGACRNISNYNYLQAMYQDECSAVNCTPIQLCSAVPGDSIQCTGSIGPDHWEFLDGAVSFLPG